MSPAIKISGRSTGASKSSKPAARKTGRSTPAAAKRSTAKRSGGTQMSDGRVRRETTDDPKVINRYAKQLKKAGDARDRLFTEHKEAVQEVYEITREAMDAGVPTGVIVDNARISRQWLYKMGEHADRGENSNGAAKPKRGPGRPRKNTATSKPASRSTGSKKLTIRSR